MMGQRVRHREGWEGEITQISAAGNSAKLRKDDGSTTAQMAASHPSKKIAIFIGVLLHANVVSAQTFLSVDAMWTQSMVITEQVHIFPSTELLVNGSSAAPVTLTLAADASIIIYENAQLILNHVIIIGEGAQEPAITFASEQAGFLRMQNVNCSFHAICVLRKCCHGNLVHIFDSLFEGNSIALSGYSGKSSAMVVHRSTFSRNTVAVTSADYEFYDCLFSENDEAFRGERVVFFRTRFERNRLATTDRNTFKGGAAFFVTDCLFIDNDIGIGPNCCGQDYSPVVDSTFIGNRVAIQMASGGTWRYERVNILNSTEYALQYTGTGSVAVTQVYWGTSDTQAIDAMVYDLVDGASGLVIVQPPVPATRYCHSLLSQNGGKKGGDFGCQTPLPPLPPSPFPSPPPPLSPPPAGADERPVVHLVTLEFTVAGTVSLLPPCIPNTAIPQPPDPRLGSKPRSHEHDSTGNAFSHLLAIMPASHTSPLSTHLAFSHTP